MISTTKALDIITRISVVLTMMASLMTFKWFYYTMSLIMITLGIIYLILHSIKKLKGNRNEDSTEIENKNPSEIRKRN